VLIAAQAFVVIVALLHTYFLVLESFLWATPFGEKTFGRTHEQQLASKSLAQNQGLYNGFLVAGLVWSFFVQPDFAYAIRLFFLICVVVAGVVGAITVTRKILFIQAAPAAIGVVLVLLSH